MATPVVDYILNYTQIHCFSEQLWQGNLYPRWCMEANLGHGSPALLFYFPLPYYIAAIFHPFGFDLNVVYLLSNGLANITAFITCFLWLQTIVTAKRAAFCAFVLLWLPYHMEVETARRSYAELWCLSLLPLVFLYIRQIIVSSLPAWPKLALAVAVCFLCHAPATIIGLMGAGLYALILCRGNYRGLAYAAGAVALGFLATLFHWAAAKFFSGSLSDTLGGVNEWRKIWLNQYMDVSELDSNIGSLYVFFIVTMPMVFAAAVWAWFRRKRIDNACVYNEFNAWLGIMVFAFLLIFSISDPVWAVIEKLSQVKTPWRMQSLIMFGTVYLLAIAAQWLLAAPHKKREGNAIVAAVFFMFLGLSYVQSVDPREEEGYRRFVAARYILPYFAPRWVDESYITDKPKFLADFADTETRARLPHGKASVTQWNYDGIVIATENAKSGTLQIDQFYFPLWHATLDGEPLTIRPEAEKGRILADIPAGRHDIRFYISVSEALPPAYRYTWLLSLAAFLGIIYGFYRGLTSPRGRVSS